MKERAAEWLRQACAHKTALGRKPKLCSPLPGKLAALSFSTPWCNVSMNLKHHLVAVIFKEKSCILFLCIASQKTD